MLRQSRHILYIEQYCSIKCVSSILINQAVWATQFYTAIHPLCDGDMVREIAEMNASIVIATSKYEYPSLAMLDIDGTMTTTSIVMGILLLILCLPGLILNLICLITLYKKDFISNNKKNPNVFSISELSKLISDTAQLLNLVLYSVPANIMQVWLLPRRFIRLPGWFLMFNWHTMQMHLCYIAFDRFLAVCKPQWFHYVNTYNTSVVACLMSWLFGFVIVMIGQIMMPCCRMYMWYKLYTAAYLPVESHNYAGDISLSLNITASVVIILAYGGVLFTLRQTNRKVMGNANDEDRRARHDQEARLAKQFLAISSFYVGCFGLFETLPYILPPGVDFVWQLVSVFLAFNNSVNGFVYMAYNPKLRTAVLLMFGKTTTVTVVTGTTATTVVAQKNNDQAKF